MFGRELFIIGEDEQLLWCENADSVMREIVLDIRLKENIATSQHGQQSFWQTNLPVGKSSKYGAVSITEQSSTDTCHSSQHQAIAANNYMYE